jgi:glycosyltransferase involved in cell wall biosynthesis
MEFNINNDNELLVRNYTSTEYKEKYITFKEFLQYVYEDFFCEQRLAFNQACADFLKNTLIKENDVIKKKGFDEIKNFLYNFINEKDPKNVKSRLQKKIADKDSLSLLEFYTQIFYPVKTKKKKKKTKCRLS